jgi:hypothetical protein
MWIGVVPFIFAFSAVFIVVVGVVVFVGEGSLVIGVFFI